jgi:hypothetical protein
MQKIQGTGKIRLTFKTTYEMAPININIPYLHHVKPAKPTYPTRDSDTKAQGGESRGQARYA